MRVTHSLCSVVLSPRIDQHVHLGRSPIHPLAHSLATQDAACTPGFLRLAPSFPHMDTRSPFLLRLQHLPRCRTSHPSGARLQGIRSFTILGEQVFVIQRVFFQYLIKTRVTAPRFGFLADFARGSRLLVLLGRLGA